MADQNYRVAYLCAWCGESFHQVDDRYSMHPCAVYVDYDGRQFDSAFCRKMFNDGMDEDCNDVVNGCQ